MCGGLWRDSRGRVLDTIGQQLEDGKMGDNRTASRESLERNGILYSHSSVDMSLNAETGGTRNRRPRHPQNVIAVNKKSICVQIRAVRIKQSTVR